MILLQSIGLILTICIISIGADDLTFYNPMSSSSYARVQYANNNNSVIRRLGAHRDPTIQYVNFDDLYNKHHVNPMVKPSYGHKYHTDRKQNEVASSTVSWEEAPDLTNGWTIEKEVKVTSPMPSKGLDYVYAYSNGYHAYSEHDNYPKKKEMAPVTTTTTQQSIRGSGYVVGPGHETAEYAHYSDSVVDADTTPSAQPPVVMEASWSEKQKKIDKTLTAVTNKPFETIVQTVRTTTSSLPPPLPPAPKTEQAVRRNGNGVQSGWRPFSGPSTPSPAANVPEAPAAPTTDSTLFYSDAKKNVDPISNDQLAFQNVPVFVMDREPTSGISNVIFPNTNENEIKQKPKFPQFSSLQPSASISVSGPNDRPIVNNNNNQNNNNQFQPNINRFERPAQQNLVIPSNLQPSNDRPPFHPSFAQQNRPQFNAPQLPQRPQQQSLMPQRPQQQSLIPQRPQQPSLMPPQRPPPQQQPQWDRFNPANANGNRRPSVPFGMRNPTNKRPDFMPPPQQQPQAPPMPSGPVGLSPQLQPNQGQPDQSHMTIRLPLPKPGVGLGSSPQNPLPGPPIFLTDNERLDNQPQQQNGHPNDGQFGLPPRFPPHQVPPNFRPQPPMPPQGHFRPPQGHFPPQGPPPTSTATSFIKNFFSKIFPFARSMDLDEDYTEAYNGTSTEAYNGTSTEAYNGTSTEQPLTFSNSTEVAFNSTTTLDNL